MAFIPATNVLQVEIRGTYFGQEVENVLYFLGTGLIGTAEVDDLFDWMETVFLPDWLDGKSNSYVVDELYGTDLTTSTSPTYGRTLSPTQAGGESGAAGLPGNVNMAISFRSENRGRSGRGRNYWAGLTENEVSGNTIDVSMPNLIVAAYELLLGGGTFPSFFTWVILSRFFDNAPRVSALAQAVVDVLSTDLTVDSQRGRLRT